MDKPDRRNYTDLETVIANAVAAAMAPLAIADETHREHHSFIKQWIEKEQRKAERWDKIKTQVGGWAIVTFLGGIGTAAYHAFNYLREHLK
mgnify:CR=1 FL=1